MRNIDKKQPLAKQFYFFLKEGGAWRGVPPCRCKSLSAERCMKNFILIGRAILEINVFEKNKFVPGFYGLS